MRWRNKLILSSAAITAVFTVVVVLLFVNVNTPGPNIIKPLETSFRVGDPLFMRTVGHLLGPGFTEGNSVKPLRNGDEIFPAMLNAIRAARGSVNFETYVWWNGKVAEAFAQAFAERARNGVQVRILLDWLAGRSITQENLTLLEESGAIVEFFRPLNWYDIDRANHRTHRKFLIVDGKVGFTGGVGIGDEWLGNAQDEDHWRDTHFELRGPVVAQLQAGFADHWMKVHREVLQGKEFFPELPPQGDMVAQAFNSDGTGGGETVRTLFLLSIAGAKESIRIGNPYFVPDRFVLQTLLSALRRGVEVEVLTTGPNDSMLAKSASRALWGDLLEAGAQFYRFDHTLYHTKMMVVDEQWVAIGSANFDNRSFLYNDENNVNVLDRELAADMLAQFERDKALSTHITLELWRDRPLRERLLEWWARLFESQV